LDKIPEIIRNAENALLFEDTETEYALASNIFMRDNFCTIFGMDWKQIQEKLITALDNPLKPVIVNENPFEEAELELGKPPILKYYSSNPRPYITSGVFVTECEERNLSYHRILVKTKNTGTTRICHARAGKNLGFTDGGINWLGCSVSIKKRNDEEPKKIIKTTLDTHKSLKHVFVFDEYINLSDPQDMLWALTTRFQADKDLYTYPDSPGSSLDPNSESREDRRKIWKAGFDCTIPLSKDKKDFEKVF
jgi:3-polyprenyl-4-hydroxybenzoate decarboxylase